MTQRNKTLDLDGGQPSSGGPKMPEMIHVIDTNTPGHRTNLASPAVGAKRPERVSNLVARSGDHGRVAQKRVVAGTTAFGPDASNQATEKVLDYN